MSRVLVNGQRDQRSIPGRVISKIQKMILNAALLNNQHYKVRIKNQVEQSREGVAPFPTPRCSSYLKGSLWVTLTFRERTMRGNLIEAFKTEEFLLMVDIFSILLLELKTYCQSRFQKLSLLNNWVFFC